jgi:hypothetical protein
MILTSKHTQPQVGQTNPDLSRWIPRLMEPTLAGVCFSYLALVLEIKRHKHLKSINKQHYTLLHCIYNL